MLRCGLRGGVCGCLIVLGVVTCVCVSVCVYLDVSRNTGNGLTVRMGLEKKRGLDCNDGYMCGPRLCEFCQAIQTSFEVLSEHFFRVAV